MEHNETGKKESPYYIWRGFVGHSTGGIIENIPNCAFEHFVSQGHRIVGAYCHIPDSLEPDEKNLLNKMCETAEISYKEFCTVAFFPRPIVFKSKKEANKV